MANTHENIRVEYILSGPDFPAGCKGKKGFITKEVVTEVVPDYKDRTFYLPGPVKMICRWKSNYQP